MTSVIIRIRPMLLVVEVCDLRTKPRRICAGSESVLWLCACRVLVPGGGVPGSRFSAVFVLNTVMSVTV